MTELSHYLIKNARENYRLFIDRMFDGGSSFRITSHSDTTPYARCFALFGLHLLKDKIFLLECPDRWAKSVRADLDNFRSDQLAKGVDLSSDKPYLQLLTFSLSALATLDWLDYDPLADHVIPILSKNIDADLRKYGVFHGKARSGNQAMFMAILLIYSRDRLGIDDCGQIARWKSLHLESINEFGFWGKTSSMTYLQFQNGYHQYEILKYLDAAISLWDKAADHVASLADTEGHFAPYPGGGGCYDYDAVFLITGAGMASTARHRDLLMRTSYAILAEQNRDGGFCESHYIRPRSFSNLMRIWHHMSSTRPVGRYERLRYGLTLLRPRHDRIRTHWSRYSREGNESDLWDSWFRMLTLARIDVAFNPSAADQWGFIDFPGIGYHHSLRSHTTGNG